jgi:DNA-directed RNA polymerase specialized sigma24 family protein
MRRLLVDHARGKMAQKRGADAPKVLISEGYHDGLQPSMDAAELIDLDRALDELATAEPRLARLVELRFFSGLGIEEASSLLGCSPAPHGQARLGVRARVAAQSSEGCAMNEPGP